MPSDFSLFFKFDFWQIQNRTFVLIRDHLNAPWVTSVKYIQSDPVLHGFNTFVHMRWRGVTVYSIYNIEKKEEKSYTDQIQEIFNFSPNKKDQRENQKKTFLSLSDIIEHKIYNLLNGDDKRTSNRRQTNQYFRENTCFQEKNMTPFIGTGIIWSCGSCDSDCTYVSWIFDEVRNWTNCFRMVNANAWSLQRSPKLGVLMSTRFTEQHSVMRPI